MAPWVVVMGAASRRRHGNAARSTAVLRAPWPWRYWPMRAAPHVEKAKQSAESANVESRRTKRKSKRRSAAKSKSEVSKCRRPQGTKLSMNRRAPNRHIRSPASFSLLQEFCSGVGLVRPSERSHEQNEERNESRGHQSPTGRVVGAIRIRAACQYLRSSRTKG